METIPTVSWTELQGNKYAKALSPQMLTKNGLPTILKARVIGTQRHGGDFVTVIFDRDYVVSWLITKVIRVLSNEGLEAILQLVKEAWQKSGYPTEPQHKPVFFSPEEMN